MAFERRQAQGKRSMTRSVVTGVTMCLAATVAGSAVCAALISSEIIGAAKDGYCTMVILLLASILGSISAKGEGKGLYTALLVCAIYVSILLAVTACFFGGQYEGVGVTALVVISGSILPLIMGINDRKGAKIRRSKMRHR